MVVYSSIIDKIKYSLFLRVYIENYFSQTVLSYLVLKNFISFGRWKDYFNSVFCFLSLAIFTLSPFIILVFLHTKRSQRKKNKAFKQKFDSLWENTTSKRPMGLYYIFIYLLKRLIFGVSLILLPILPQLLLQMLFSLLQLSMIIRFKPMK